MVEPKKNKKKKSAPKHTSKAVKKPKKEKNLTQSNTNEEKKKREEKLKKLTKLKGRKKFVIGGILGVAAIYIIGVIFFSIFNYPQTTVADTDVSFQTAGAMERSLAQNSTEYTFTADGLGFYLTIAGDEINYYFDTKEVVGRIEALKNPLAWPYEIFQVHDFKDNFVVSFDEDKVVKISQPAIEAHNKTAALPMEPGFNCDIATKTATIRPEIEGNTLNPEATIKSIKSTIGSARKHLEVGSDEQLKPSLTASDPRMDNALQQANKALKADISLMMSTTAINNVSTKEVAAWLYVTPSYNADLSGEALSQWATSLADTYNTVGKSRTYVAPYGKTVTVEGGPMGWEINVDELIIQTHDQAMAGFIGQLTVPCNSSLNGYAGPGSRDWGNRYIDIDLSQQHARMYDDSGSLIWEADIVSGKPDGKHNTPTGVFCINNKQSPSKLVGENVNGKPEYETTVQYWMAFRANDIGLHDASWQSGFGGERYKTSAGSHGCVNLSSSAAAALYGICTTGDIVVCHN
ncbi:MAG: L,D-transpeptidase family protein [Coriobacteriia bacterium]|nr:L,D-transpeptidase family protein [Coriobacteriia bacterium]